MASIEKTNDNEILNTWSKKWEKSDTIWQKDCVNIHLQKYFDGFRSTIAEGEGFNVFVPLCGETLDIKWLLDKGCSVVGVEGVDLAIQKLFQHNNLSFHITPLQGDDLLYQCDELPLKIYKCNIFDFPNYNSQKFELVWDRGSFVAINPEQRERYVGIMKSLYSPRFFHLLESYVYESKTFYSNPYSLPFSVVKELLGGKFKYEDLEKEDIKEALKALSTDFQYMFLQIFLISNQ